jgi:hypothetical protein
MHPDRYSLYKAPKAGNLNIVFLPKKTMTAIQKSRFAQTVLKVKDLKFIVIRSGGKNNNYYESHDQLLKIMTNLCIFQLY